MRFRDRADAGQRLATVVEELTLTNPIVLALPRGGVPVGFEVARALHAPLDVFVARKIGAPHHPELGIGAIAEGGGIVVDERLIRALGVSERELEELVEQEQRELQRRVRSYRRGRPLPPLAGHNVVLVDDGLATGVTAAASLRALRAREPGRIVLAVPVCAPETVERLRSDADDIVCVASPPNFAAVGTWYDDFRQTSDDEVLDLLAHATSTVPTRS